MVVVFAPRAAASLKLDAARADALAAAVEAREAAQRARSGGVTG